MGLPATLRFLAALALRASVSKAQRDARGYDRALAASNATAAPTAAPLVGGGGADHDLKKENVYIVVGCMITVLLTVVCCFKCWPHLEYERAKRNNRIYPGAVIVVKPASPGTAAPLVFGHQSYDLPTPAERKTQLRRHEKNSSAERAARETKMLEHEKAEAVAREAEPPPTPEVAPRTSAMGSARFFAHLPPAKGAKGPSAGVA